MFDAISEVIPDPRNPVFVVHDQQSMIAQRIVAIALGYEDLNDHTTLRHDPLWQVLAEADPDSQKPLASAPTLCRLENRAHRRTLFEMSKVLVEQFIASFKEPPDCLVLDFDATDDIVHGHQEGRFFHGYYDNYCF
ncbi:MAG: transposase, partial [Singulisphaera sp.]|nr:transposase [Singulisphaera sp.]